MIADDHPLIRRVVREVVEKEDDLEIIAEARNGHEAEVQAAQTQPDVVLMDLDMPQCDGFEATERVLACSPNSRIVILTGSTKEQHALEAIQKGAVGYITKDVEPEALIHAIRCAARNELCMPRSLTTQVLAHMRSLATTEGSRGKQRYSSSRNASPGYKIPQRPTADGNGQGYTRPLTDREQEILDLMRKGSKNREIAKELSIAESTVHKHIQNIFEKLHARNRTEAIYLTSANAV
ncbi:MAG: response regulator transcription factor [Chloroflexota bacterium]|nr:response regulator transcription factor [Chloroflexota bacterium]